MFDDSSSGIINPAGRRPFKSASEFGELDEAFTDARDGGFSILTVIPQGTARRRAMELIHHKCSHVLKHIHASASHDRRLCLKASVSRSAFTAACDNSSPIAQDELVLGLEDPFASQFDTVAVRAMAEQRYKGVIDKARMARTKEIELPSKQKEDSRKDQEALDRAKPEFLVEALIKSTVKDQVSKTVREEFQADGGDDDMHDADHHADHGMAARFVEVLSQSRSHSNVPSQVMSKNGLPPESLPGFNKGKGKGKHKVINKGFKTKGGQRWERQTKKGYQEGKSNVNKGKGKAGRGKVEATAPSFPLGKDGKGQWFGPMPTKKGFAMETILPTMDADETSTTSRTTGSPSTTTISRAASSVCRPVRRERKQQRQMIWKVKRKAIQCDPDRRVHLSFKRFTNDFNMTDWHIFAQFSLLRSSAVYYDHQQKAVHPAFHELPWPITWILFTI